MDMPGMPPAPFEAPELGPMPEHGVAPALQAGPPPRPAEPRTPGPPEAQWVGAPQPMHDIYAAPVPQPPSRMAPMPWPLYGQAVGAAPAPPSGARTGLTLLTVAVSTAVGAKFGGWPGAAAGLLAGGASVNTVRAFNAFKQGTEEGDHEGRISALFAVVGSVASGLIWWRYVTPEHMHANPLETEEEEELVDDDLGEHPGMPCGIRPVGP